MNNMPDTFTLADEWLFFGRLDACSFSVNDER
jgi:hypothetical protein